MSSKKVLANNQFLFITSIKSKTNFFDVPQKWIIYYSTIQCYVWVLIIEASRICIDILIYWYLVAFYKGRKTTHTLIQVTLKLLAYFNLSIIPSNSRYIVFCIFSFGIIFDLYVCFSFFKHIYLIHQCHTK